MRENISKSKVCRFPTTIPDFQFLSLHHTEIQECACTKYTDHRVVNTVNSTSVPTQLS